MPKHYGAVFSLMTVLFVCTPNGNATIIVTNGGFESLGTLYSGALGGIYQAVGWTNNSGLNIQAASAGAGTEGTNPLGVTGNYYLRLASDCCDPGNTGFIVQDLGTMVAGQTYTFTGDALGGNGNINWGAAVELTSDGSLTPATVYSTQTLSGFAAGAFGVGALDISYTATAADNGNPLFLWLRAEPSGSGQDVRGGLDNIQLTTTGVPEPATLALLSSGFALLTLFRRRRLS
jgi:hypothetical protein